MVAMINQNSLIFVLILIYVQLSFITCANKSPKPFNETYSKKYDNPDFVRDRFKKISKPDLTEHNNKTKRIRPKFQNFHPAYMDYCDPYHCNDYHKPACGLNRNNMKFKWFQSGCHIILNNMCATYRGFLKYDMIDPKYCVAYVMFLRSGCAPCSDDSIQPICGLSLADQSVLLFKNRCAMDTANCNPETLNDFVEVNMFLCALKQIHNLNFDSPPQKIE